MATASLFTNGKSQALRILKELEFKGINEVEIIRDGDSIILRPKGKSWSRFSAAAKTNDDFILNRPDVIDDSRLGFEKNVHARYEYLFFYHG
jgi:antitoxin VapB